MPVVIYCRYFGHTEDRVEKFALKHQVHYFYVQFILDGFQPPLELGVVHDNQRLKQSKLQGLDGLEVLLEWDLVLQTGLLKKPHAFLDEGVLELLDQTIDRVLSSLKVVSDQLQQPLFSIRSHIDHVPVRVAAQPQFLHCQHTPCPPILPKNRVKLFLVSSRIHLKHRLQFALKPC